MSRVLLLICLFLIAGTTLSFAQSDPTLGKASKFVVLSSEYITNSGTTGVTGHLGISPGTALTDNGELFVSGQREIGNTSAADALQDALAGFDFLKSRPVTQQHFSNELGGRAFYPGVHKLNGNANLSGIMLLDAGGNVNATFVFIISGNLTTASPVLPTPSTGLLLQNGAQAKNVYWVVDKEAHLGGATLFQGNMLVKGNIKLDTGVGLMGRAISLEGGISLNTNNIFLPTLGVADLGVEKRVEDGNYLIGSEVTYTVVARNGGPGTATNVVVAEQIPAGLEFVRATAEQGAYNEAARQWEIGALMSGQSVKLTITFKVTAAGGITNKVTIRGDSPDPNLGDNEAEVPISVPAISADLRVTKTANDGLYYVGNNVIYTIVVENNGPYTAENVKVTETLPTKLELVSSNANKGSYDANSGVYTVGSLAKGESATLTITAKILEPGIIQNVVTATTDTPVRNPEDDSDSEEIEADCTVPTIAVTGKSSQCEGLTEVYTATEIPGATYSFTLPAGWVKIAETANSVTATLGAASGKIIVTVKDLCGKTYTAEKEVTVLTKPAAPTINGPEKVCANSTDNIYIIPASGTDMAYEWAVTGDLEVISGKGTGTVTVRAGTLGGTLSVKARNACFRSEEASINIGINPLPETPGTITGETAVCAGAEVMYRTDAAAGAESYTWALPTGWEILDGEGTQQITVRTGETSGDVAVAATNYCGSSETITLAVTINTKPAAPEAIQGETTACEGTELLYSIAETNGATGYTWTVPEGWAITSGQNTTAITVKVGTGAGHITAAVLNECGMGEAVSLSVAAITTGAAGKIAGASEVCLGSEALTYSVAAVEGATTYTWAVPADWTILEGQGSTQIKVSAGTADGSIAVTAAGKCGNGGVSALDVRVVPPPAAAGMISDNSTVCDGLTYSIESVPGATSYTWAVPEGFTITAGQGTTTIKVKADSPNAFGNVTVAATNGNCEGLEASASIDATLADGNLNFPKAFSPNGDGKNDTWVITNLEKFPDNDVVIFNRWGGEVFRKMNYQNNWRGIGLEQGTYFYKTRVTLCGGVVKEFTGYVSIFR